jgi:hypothetical protein
MRTVRLLIVAIVAAISSLAGVQAVSYAVETNEVEIWFKAIKELQRMVKENDNYIALCDAKIAEKKLMLEEARRQSLPTDKLESEIDKLQRERAIRFDLGKRWKVELNSVTKNAEGISR